MIYASYEVGTQSSSAEVNADFIKMPDVQVVREQLADRIVAATGIECNYDSTFINGKENGCAAVAPSVHLDRHGRA